MVQFSYLSALLVRLRMSSICLSFILLRSREERQGLQRSPHSTTTISTPSHGSSSSLSSPRLQQVRNWSWMCCNLLREHEELLEVEVVDTRIVWSKRMSEMVIILKCCSVRSCYQTASVENTNIMLAIIFLSSPLMSPAAPPAMLI